MFYRDIQTKNQIQLKKNLVENMFGLLGGLGLVKLETSRRRTF